MVKLTAGEAVAKFFRANLRHSKGSLYGQPFILEGWQQEDINLIFELDEKGRRKWRTVVYGLPRGQGKSPLAAGIGLLELVARSDAPEVFCAAGSRDQAKIVHDFAFQMSKGGPLKDYIEFPRSRSSPLSCPYNDGIMRVISADGDLQHGLSISVVIIDELHVFKTNKQEELYFALLTATQKRENSIFFITTTAGSNKVSLLGEKYDAMIKTHKLEFTDDGCRVVGKDESIGSLLIWRGAPDTADISDRKIWRKVNPASWIPLEELERLAAEVPENVFRRYVLNQWVVGNDAAFQPQMWDALCNPKLAEIKEDENVWVAVDVGERRDSSAIVVISPLPDGRFRVKVKIFNPKEERKKTLLPLIESEIRRLASIYSLQAVAFDPWQFRRSAELLASDGLRMVEIPQIEKHMVPASQLLFDLIEQKKIIHDGDKTLRQHILSAEAKQTPRGTWRLAKPLQPHGSKVDAAIALAMACILYSYENKKGENLWIEVW